MYRSRQLPETCGFVAGNLHQRNGRSGGMRWKTSKAGFRGQFCVASRDRPTSATNRARAHFFCMPRHRSHQAMATTKTTLKRIRNAWINPIPVHRFVNHNSGSRTARPSRTRSAIHHLRVAGFAFLDSAATLGRMTDKSSSNDTPASARSSGNQLCSCSIILGISPRRAPVSASICINGRRMDCA